MQYKDVANIIFSFGGFMSFSVVYRSMIQFRWLVRGFLSLRHVFTPSAIHMQFVMNKILFSM